MNLENTQPSIKPLGAANDEVMGDLDFTVNPDQEYVGSFRVSEFTLDEVNWMLSNPGLFEGKEIPDKDSLLELKKILSAKESRIQ